MRATHMAPLETLRSHLSTLPTLTAVRQTINNFTRLLLQHYALSHGSSHLILGSSLTSLSVALISGISQGGGFVVNEERQEVWKGLNILRPLRDVGAKECAAMLWWRRLEVIARLEGAESSKRESLSIQQLTRGK